MCYQFRYIWPVISFVTTVSSHFLDDHTNSGRKTIVWNNSHIKLNNKVVFYKHWVDRGIKYIEQLYDDRTNDFYTLDNFQFIYNITATYFIVYSSFVKSIPISITNRCVLDNAINDSNVQIIQIALRTNKVIRYVNSLQKCKTKTKQEVKWDIIIVMYSKSIYWNQAYIHSLSVQHQTQF